MGKTGVPNKKYAYFRLTKNGNRKEEFTAYSDIALEYETTRNTIAGKFYRAAKNNTNIINVNGNRIERIEKIACKKNS